MTESIQESQLGKQKFEYYSTQNEEHVNDETDEQLLNLRDIDILDKENFDDHHYGVQKQQKITSQKDYIENIQEVCSEKHKENDIETNQLSQNHKLYLEDDVEQIEISLSQDKTDNIRCPLTQKRFFYEEDQAENRQCCREQQCIHDGEMKNESSQKQIHEASHQMKEHHEILDSHQNFSTQPNIQADIAHEEEKLEQQEIKAENANNHDVLIDHTNIQGNIAGDEAINYSIPQQEQPSKQNLAPAPIHNSPLKENKVAQSAPASSKTTKKQERTRIKLHISSIREKPNEEQDHAKPERTCECQIM